MSAATMSPCVGAATAREASVSSRTAVGAIRRANTGSRRAQRSQRPGAAGLSIFARAALGGVLGLQQGPSSLLCRAVAREDVASAPSVASDSLARVRGETQGAAVVIQDATITIGNNDLMEGVNFRCTKGERWAFVGPNGCGKSTLMKAITGQNGVRLSAGSLTIHDTWQVGFLEQKGVSGSVLSVREEVKSRMDRLVLAEAALKEAEIRMESCDVSDENALGKCASDLGQAEADFAAAGGYVVDEKVSKVLKGLGFTDMEFDRPCTSFSGGWQMRIALARLLLSEPEVLILDEPTNHLDAAARRWLSTYLAQYTGTVLLVSHDEGLLRTAATSIAEVRNRRLDTFKSRSYDQWLLEREEREAQRAAEYEKQQAEIAHLQSFVDRFGASATKASQAQSRVKMIEKLKSNSVAAPEGVQRFRPRLNLPKPPPCSFEQLELKDASFGWTDVPIVQGVSLKFRKGDRVVVRGPNGAGKSTLLRALSGELPLMEGTRKEGDGLCLGFFKQDLAQELPMNERAMDVVQRAGWEVDSSLTVTQVRTIMGALGLSGDKSVRPVGQLSGGEKARVALSCFAVVPHNYLLLDEPSNHLDVETIASLTDAIRSFEGAVVVISHDRQFCEALEPTHVITVDEGVATMEGRDLREDDWRIDDMAAQAPASVSSSQDMDSESSGPVSAPVRPAAPPVAVGMDPKQRKAKERAVSQLEAKMEKKFQKIDTIQANINKEIDVMNFDKVGKLQEKVDALEAEAEEIMLEIDGLMAELE